MVGWFYQALAVLFLVLGGFEKMGFDTIGHSPGRYDEISSAMEYVLVDQCR